MLLRRVAILSAAAVGMLGYTKLIWQSAFDQGASVSLCVVASLQNDGRFDQDSLACQRAKQYESNPLWLLRRRWEGQ